MLYISPLKALGVDVENNLRAPLGGIARVAQRMGLDTPDISVGVRSGDTVEGPVRSPREGERYFALLKADTINFESPDAIKHKVHFDNLTPLYPEERLRMEIDDPTL